MTVQERLQEHYNEVLTLFPEEQVFFVALQGSQNYNMADDTSDVDTKAVVIPSLEDIIFNRDAKSYTHIRANDEHIDIKDIRLMFQQYRKQNINFVETLFSKYVIVNPKYLAYWNMLQEHREDIARYNPCQAMKTMCGMCSEKYHALTHEYPSRMEFITTYGYDGKQLSHLMRVYEFMENYSKGVPYEDCLIPSNTEYLRGVKRHVVGITLEDAKLLGKEYMEGAVVLKNDFLDTHENKPNKQVDVILDQVQKQLMKQFLKEQLKEE